MRWLEVHIDTNHAGLEPAETMLSALGIDLLYSAVVGDNVERLRHAVNTALSRSGLLIMTGGLGPTTDDLTKETTAACAGKKWP